MSLIEQFKSLAKQSKKTIILPEGDDERMIDAANEITKQDIANIIILGNEETLTATFKEKNYPINCQFINPEKNENLDDFATTFYEMRKEKGMTKEKAIETLKDPLYFGFMMVKKGMADGAVAGAKNTTGAVLRSAIQVIGTKPGMKTVSSCFIMDTKKKEMGENGAIIFADCAVNPNPNSQQLADIAVSSAKSCSSFLKTEPKVAMLSFSTKGSAKHDDAKKVIDALKIIQTSNPELNVDGEMQLDAALINAVGEKKAPGSTVAGNANVLVFPDLDAGNIGYKLVERLANADAIGPIIQGLDKPVNDLSRGCSYMDIVNVTAITAVQAN